MAQTFGTFKSLADQRDRAAIARAKAAAANAVDEMTPIADAARLPVASHQERVNAEMFKALEVLGRKIDRAFDEREHLTRRLALIESAATVDEKTGKLYLPVIAENAPAPQLAASTPAAPRWMALATVLSTAIAVAALALVVTRPPQQALTAEQIAILDALAQTRMGALTAPMSGTASADSWQNVDTAGIDDDMAPPSDAQLVQPEATPEAETAYDIDEPVAGDMSVAPAAQSLPEEKTLAPVEDAQPAADTDTEASLPAATPAPVTASTPDTAAMSTPAPVASTPVAAPEDKTQLAMATPAKKPATIAQDTRTAPPPLTAGLDIGRDTTLPASLIGLETRAMEGIAAAQHDLATIYAAGKQTKQDYKRSAYWFSQAAEGNIANAHYNLGVMFQQGLGLRKDTAKAMDWYQSAADLGHPEALYNLGIAYIEGVGAPRDVDRGIGYFEKAAKAGVAQAAYNLGVLYESGFAGPIDAARARTWYETASKHNHSEARAALARIDAQLPQPASLTAADMVEPAPRQDVQAPAPQPAAQKKSVGSANDLVAKVQRALIGRGLLPAPASGLLDARTEDAIRAFQRANNIAVDGIPSLTLLGQINQTSR